MAYIKKPSIDDDYNQADQFVSDEKILSTLPCISINEIADHHLIGGQAKLGSYWRATNPIFGCIVLKMFKSCRLEDFRREIEILTLDNHQRFVQAFGMTIVDRSPGIVFEYFKKGNCKTYLAKNSNYSNQLAATWCKQLVNAMSFLHDRSIIHQDIRPKNIFVTDNTLSVKLGGFSLARKAGPKEEMSFMYPQIAEAFPYNAPEFLSRQYYSKVEYGFPADVYSLSITICELLSKQLVFPDVDTEKLKAEDFYYQLEYWKNKKRDFNPKEPYFELISICAQEDLASRPKMKELSVLLSDWLDRNWETRNRIERLCLKETSEQREKEDYDSLSVIPEMNILVLGQTGVGKSTFINALATYITYGFLDEAVSKDLVALIPTKFHQTDSDMKELTIETGKSGNESFVEGKSATKSPRAYILKHNDCRYRIIDTPGIGDADGIMMDRQNMENIMHFTAQYEKIHAICVLLLPNVARLTEEFKFCFKELFVQFHKSAADNIIFCYTNTSGYMFKPQNTLTQLELLLKEIDEKHHVQISARDKNRTYSFDNMAYRYCCIKNLYPNFKFSADKSEDDLYINLYAQSYTISRKESDRMLEFIRTLTPHDLKESMDIFYVRRMIKCCTNPLTAIGNAIQKTITQIDEYKEQVRGCGDNVKELERMLMKKVSIIRWKMWFEEREWCKTCATIREYTGAERLALVEADPSQVNEDPIKMYTPLKYLEKKEKCANCGWSTRRVISNKTFQSFTEEKEEEDISVASRIRNKEDMKKELNENICSNEVLKKEIESEQKQIYEVCAKGAFFLQKNALSSINDATEFYLKKLIESGEKSGTIKKVQEYKKMLDNYLNEKKIFYDYMQHGERDESIRSDRMMELLNGLKKMKHYGKNVEDAMNQALKPVRIDSRGEELEKKYIPSTMFGKIKKGFSRLLE